MTRAVEHEMALSFAGEEIPYVETVAEQLETHGVI
jgi:Uncharacterized protein containing a TIR (Toll-Interleukin 1-resistance) domain